MSIYDLFKKIETPRTPAGKPQYIVAGLGNPGREYEMTRHNAGFLALDHIAGKLGVTVNRAKYRALTAEAVIDGVPVLLMKPQTFMNSSGIALSEAADFYKIPMENVIVICDDIAQAPGKMRIRRSGSAGGHNGLKSIIGMLGGEGFPRVRLGVGEKPNPQYDLAAWVTGVMPEADRKAMSARFDDAYSAVSLILKGNFEQAMCLYNGK